MLRSIAGAFPAPVVRLSLSFLWLGDEVYSSVPGVLDALADLGGSAMSKSQFVAVKCKLSKGLFSSERAFKVILADKTRHSGPGRSTTA